VGLPRREEKSPRFYLGREKTGKHLAEDARKTRCRWRSRRTWRIKEAGAVVAISPSTPGEGKKKNFFWGRRKQTPPPKGEKFSARKEGRCPSRSLTATSLAGKKKKDGKTSVHVSLFLFRLPGKGKKEKGRKEGASAPVEHHHDAARVQQEGRKNEKPSQLVLLGCYSHDYSRGREKPENGSPTYSATLNRGRRKGKRK